MPTGGSASVLATELERVESKIPILFEREDTFYSQVEKRPAEIVSEVAMRVPMEIHPSGVTGQFSSDGGDLGTGDMPDYDKATVNTVEIKHAMQWTTRRKFATDSTRKAVINAFRRDLANGMKELRRALDCLCMTAGNGVLATITSNSNSGGAAGTDTCTCTTDGFGVRLLRMKQPVSIWDPTLTTLRNTGSLAGEQSVTYVDGPNKIVKLNNSCNAIQNGDVIVFSGNWTAPPASILGIPYHANNASTGTWLGYNRATTPEIRANRVQASGALALPMARLAMNKAGDRLGQTMLNRRLQAWMHPCQQQAYEELGIEASIINKEAKEEGLDLYFNDNMRIAGAPVKKHYSWDKTRIDFIDLDIYGRAEFYAPQWYKDENGNKFFVMRGTSGGVAASNLAYIVCSWQLYANNPAGISYIDSLTVPTGY